MIRTGERRSDLWSCSPREAGKPTRPFKLFGLHGSAFVRRLVGKITEQFFSLHNFKEYLQIQSSANALRPKWSSNAEMKWIFDWLVVPTTEARLNQWDWGRSIQHVCPCFQTHFPTEATISSHSQCGKTDLLVIAIYFIPDWMSHPKGNELYMHLMSCRDYTLRNYFFIHLPTDGKKDLLLFFYSPLRRVAIL